MCLELVCLETVKFEGTGQKFIYLFSSPPCGLLSLLKACRLPGSSASLAGLSLGSHGYADQVTEPG